MTEETQTQSQEKKAGSRLIRIIILLLLLGAILAVLYFFVIKKSEKENKPLSINGEKVEVDDFYYAKDGTWEMETTIHLLKSKKFVSSDAELKSFLVKTVKPGETVRISQSAGRWKQLELLKDDKTIATGWADAEDGKAKRKVE